jgi:hypothetical protein
MRQQKEMKTGEHLGGQGVLPKETIARLGERRKATIAAFGILKGKDVFPDGLTYQLEVRAEWD